MKLQRREIKIASVFVVLGILLGSLVAYAATPSSTFWISSGVYPGAPSYTVWKEGSNYFAKDAYGEIQYSGTNISEIVENSINVVHANGNGTIFFKPALYYFDSPIIMKSKVSLIGEGIGFDIATELTGTGVTFRFEGVAVDTPLIDLTNGVSYAQIKGITVLSIGAGGVSLALKMGGNEDPHASRNNRIAHCQFHGDVELGSSCYFNHFDQVRVVDGSLILNGSVTSGANANTFVKFSVMYNPTKAGALSNAIYLNDAGGNTFYDLYIVASDPGEAKTVIALVGSFPQRNHFYGIYFDGAGSDYWTLINFGVNASYNTAFITNSESVTMVQSYIDNGEGNIITDRGFLVLPKWEHPTTTSWDGNQTGRIWICTTHSVVEYWNSTHIVTP